MKSVTKNSIQSKSKTLVLSFLALVLLSSCASLVSKNEYNVYFDSNPVKGNLTIIDKKNKVIFEGNTPATVSLPSYYSYFSRAEYLIKFSAEGYQKKVIPIRAKVDGWYWGNIFFGGVIGWLIIDPASGSMYKIDETIVVETLRPLPENSSASLQLIDIKDVPENYRNALVLIDALEKEE